jgi:hypothetical protein
MLYDGRDLEYLLGKQKKLKKELEDKRHTEILSNGSQEHKQISTSEEKLREITHMIYHLQSETMLREKVLFIEVRVKQIYVFFSYIDVNFNEGVTCCVCHLQIPKKCRVGSSNTAALKSSRTDN